jgi:hypothetical protein
MLHYIAFPRIQEFGYASVNNAMPILMNAAKLDVVERRRKLLRTK